MEWQVTKVSTYWVQADSAAEARERFENNEHEYISFDDYHIEVNGE